MSEALIYVTFILYWQVGNTLDSIFDYMKSLEYI